MNEIVTDSDVPRILIGEGQAKTQAKNENMFSEKSYQIQKKLFL